MVHFLNYYYPYSLVIPYTFKQMKLLFLCTTQGLRYRTIDPWPPGLTSGLFITTRKRSCGKVMFLHLSVILFTRGVSVQGGGILCSWRGTLSREGGGGSVQGGSHVDPPPYGKQRAVRILLECFFVFLFFTDCTYYLQEADDGLDRASGGVEQAESGGVHTDRAERGDRPPDTLPGQSEHRLPGRHRGWADLKESRERATVTTRRQTHSCFWGKHNKIQLKRKILLLTYSWQATATDWSIVFWRVHIFIQNWWSTFFSRSLHTVLLNLGRNGHTIILGNESFTRWLWCKFVRERKCSHCLWLEKVLVMYFSIV